MAKQDDWARITLRLPPELHARLTNEAAAASINAEIVGRLEQSFDWPVLSTSLKNAIEDSAESNSQSVQQELLARLEFTRSWDSDYFNPASDNAMGLDPDVRLGAIETRLDDLARMIRKIAGEPDPLSLPMMDEDGKPF